MNDYDGVLSQHSLRIKFKNRTEYKLWKNAIRFESYSSNSSKSHHRHSHCRHYKWQCRLTQKFEYDLSYPNPK